MKFQKQDVESMITACNAWLNAFKLFEKDNVKYQQAMTEAEKSVSLMIIKMYNDNNFDPEEYGVEWKEIK